jgi:hypothetical protein
MNKRSAMLVAAGLVVSIATGVVAFLNGGLGLPAGAATRQPAAVHRPGHVEASALRGPGASGTALSDREATRSASEGGSSKR